MQGQQEPCDDAAFADLLLSQANILDLQVQPFDQVKTLVQSYSLILGLPPFERLME